MSIFRDTKETVARFGKHIEGFQALYTKHQMSFGSLGDIWALTKKITTDGKFHNDFIALGQSILKQEGGKMSLTALFIIIGVSIGGIGIAGMGSAVGIPAAGLVALLASLGFLSGQEIDSAMGASEQKPKPSNATVRTSATVAVQQESPLPAKAALIAPADTTLLALTDALKSIQAQLEIIPHGFDRVSASMTDMHNGLGSLIHSGNARVMDTTLAKLSDVTERLEVQEVKNGQLKTTILFLCLITTLLLISTTFVAWQLIQKTQSPMIFHR